MKTSVHWLSDFLPGSSIDPQTVADALMNGGLPVESIESHGSDRVLDVEVTSNRADCLSHVGVAREIAALTKRTFVEPKIELTESAEQTQSATSVRIDAPHLCPHYTARIIRNVKIGPSPAWMVKRLEAIGLRAINNVVDVTNYVMFELGQPLHAFDFDKLAGRKIIVREAKPGETLISIDGHERKLSPGMLVIADENKPVALAGVMGGRDSEVSAATTTVLLESARFDPLSVRRTARALAMKSDSSYRFERGIDPTLPERASKRAAQLLAQIANGMPLAGVADAGAPNYKPRTITLRPQRLNRLLGIEIPTEEMLDALTRLNLKPAKNADGTITTTAPSWRADLNIEVDLIEEVARVIGYSRIGVRDQIQIQLTPPSDEAKAMEKIRSTLVGAGFFEAVTFTFVSDNLAGDFLAAGDASLPRADAAVRKADAKLRPSIVPGLLEAVRRNESSGTPGAKLFEAGSTFGADSAGKMHERRKLALVGAADLRDLRGTIELLLNALDAGRDIRVIPDQVKGYAPGAAGRIEWGGKPIGHIGRIEKTVASKLSLRETPAAAEIDLPPLIAGTQHVPQLKPLPRFPAVRRDLTLDLSDATRYDDLASLIDKLKLPLLEEVEYVTTYRGKQLDKGKKSVTTTLVFRSPTATLTSEEVETAVQRIVQEAQTQLSATLRT